MRGALRLACLPVSLPACLHVCLSAWHPASAPLQEGELSASCHCASSSFVGEGSPLTYLTASIRAPGGGSFGVAISVANTLPATTCVKAPITWRAPPMPAATPDLWTGSTSQRYRTTLHDSATPQNRIQQRSTKQLQSGSLSASHPDHRKEEEGGRRLLVGTRRPAIASMRRADSGSREVQ